MPAVTNFLVSSLPDYVKNNEDLLIASVGLPNDGTRRYIGIQTGVKKSANLNYLGFTGVFQDGELFRYDFVLLPEAQLRFRKRYNDYSHVAIRRHVWFDKTKQRIVKTYRRALNGSETTFIFKVEE